MGVTSYDNIWPSTGRRPEFFINRNTDICIASKLMPETHIALIQKFNPEDGGSMILRNVWILSHHHKASQPRRPGLERGCKKFSTSNVTRLCHDCMSIVNPIALGLEGPSSFERTREYVRILVGRSLIFNIILECLIFSASKIRESTIKWATIVSFLIHFI
jgi:hypothetical protein